jgi:hypothetical protein
MPFDDSSDITAMLEETDFATSAVYNSAATVYVIFDREYLRQLGLVAGADPSALGRASDFPAATAVGKTLLIDGTSYTIRDRMPQDDGTLVLLQLEAP